MSVLKSKIFSGRLLNIFLFSLLTLSWSFTWFVSKYIIIGTYIMPEILAAYRFAVGSLILFLVAWLCKLNLKPSRYEIKVLIISAMFGCSINLFLFFYAAYYLISGFSSVIFSTIIIMNIVTGYFFGIRQVHYLKTIILALAGICGLLFIVFAHLGDINTVTNHGNIVKGFTLGLLATLCFSISSTYYQTRKNMVSHPLVAFAYMCFFGSIWCVIYAFIHASYLDINIIFVLPITPAFVLAFLYLAIFGTAVGYLCSFTLVRRIGAVRTAYSSLIIPVVAMGVSFVFEDYRFSIWACFGIVLIIISEFFSLRDKKLK